MPARQRLPGLLSYEDLLAAQADDVRLAGVRREHRRRAVLHLAAPPATPRACSTATARPCCTPMAGALPDAIELLGARRASCRWCRCSTSTPGACPTSAAMTGAKLVLPGAGAGRQVCTSCSRASRSRCRPACPPSGRGCWPTSRPTSCKFSTMKRTVIGGSACPPAMIKTFQDDYGVEVLHAWGMTEMSPLGTVCTLKPQARRRRPRSSSCAVHGQAGPRRLRRGHEDRRRRRQGTALGRQDHRRPAGARAVDHSTRTSRARAATRWSTAGSPPATWPPSMPTATCRSPTAART